MKFTNQEDINKLKEQLTILEKSYNSGDYIAKNKKTIAGNIKDLKERINEITKIINEKEEIENKVNEAINGIHSIEAYNDLRKKLGLEKINSASFNYDINKCKEILEQIDKYKQKKLISF